MVVGAGKDISPWSVATQGASRPFVVGTADELFAAAFIRPQSGDFAAWLGGDDDVDHRLVQTVRFPSSTTRARLRGFVWIVSTENPIPVNDRLRISLFDAAGVSETELLKGFSEEDVTTGWTAFDVAVLGVYAGMTLQLRIAATTDSSKVTSFFVDTLSLEATICP